MKLLTLQAGGPVLILAGPTGVGKTDVSLTLAEQHGAEIISADSRQIYRQLNIGTAKPNPDVLATIPHHFIDELDLDQPFSAGRFAARAYERIQEIHGRGRPVIVVGGSTLYLQALQFGMAEIPEIDPQVRAKLEERLAREGARTLYQELQAVDPQAARTMDATKTQRLVRALEVYHGSGKPLTFYHEKKTRPPFSFRTVVLSRERGELYHRIEQRVDDMLNAGLLAEVEGLLKAGYSPDLNALRTIGYREPIAYLQGEIDLDEMVRLLKRNTRRYAKRQLTWFRRYNEWLLLQ